MLKITRSTSPILEPQPGCPWAEQMVLNPAFIPDPDGNRLHMLFRASGPWAHMQREGQPLPYPIFLGYAFSDDGGETWEADFSRPALAPALEQERVRLFITTADGRQTLNHANGCIEDPRLFYLDGELHMTVAARMFPPGPYWTGTPLTCCSPDWALRGDHGLGMAVTANVTVSILYRVDLAALSQRRYDEAFTYITHLTDPQKGDNRDVYLFPRKLQIDGREQYVCFHRPWTPASYAEGANLKLPSMFLAAADRLEDLATDAAKQHVLATPRFGWEANRIGGSFPPIEVEAGVWLASYHGKGAGNLGYTQSFMILEEQDRGFPRVRHRCSDRLLYATQPWELNGKFPTPCLFTCAGWKIGDDLLMSYGAADTKAGMARVNFDELVDHVRRFDADGHQIKPKATVSVARSAPVRAAQRVSA